MLNRFAVVVGFATSPARTLYRTDNQQAAEKFARQYTSDARFVYVDDTLTGERITIKAEATCERS